MNKRASLFDLLAPEIHQFIVSSLLSSIEFTYCRGKEYLMNEISLRAILNYAKQGQYHHDAVMEGLNFTIAIWDCHDVFTDLILHFANDLREIDTVYSHVRFDWNVSNIPKLPNLRKAAIWASHPELHLIRNSPNLSELSVMFFPDMDPGGTDKIEWDLLVSNISRIHLRALELIFKYPSPLKYYMLSTVDFINFREACTTVEHLSLRGYISLSDDFSRIINNMLNLKKLSLDVNLDVSDLSLLERFPELEFSDGFKDSFAVIRRLADRVITMRGFVESRSKVEALASFRCLKELHIQASGELNYEIGDIAGNLEVLSVCFPRIHLPFSGPTYPFYDKISIARFCFVMRRARKLSMLSIDQVKISSQDIEEVFKIVGSQLKQFCVCISWQEESALTRMANILRSVAKYCPNLEVLKFMPDNLAIHPILFSEKEEKGTCMKALEMVRQKCNRFTSYERVCSTIENGFKRAV